VAIRFLCRRVLLRRLVIAVDRAVAKLVLLMLALLLLVLLLMLLVLVMLVLLMLLLLVLCRRPGSPPGVHVVGATAVGKPAASSSSSSSSSPAAAGIGPAGHENCAGFSSFCGDTGLDEP
jgi:hypothetical protein